MTKKVAVFIGCWLLMKQLSYSKDIWMQATLREEEGEASR